MLGLIAPLNPSVTLPNGLAKTKLATPPPALVTATSPNILSPALTQLPGDSRKLVGTLPPEATVVVVPVQLGAAYAWPASSAAKARVAAAITERMTVSVVSG